jgi:hypothetical protein
MKINESVKLLDNFNKTIVMHNLGYSPRTIACIFGDDDFNVNVTDIKTVIKLSSTFTKKTLSNKKFKGLIKHHNEINENK